MARALRIPRDLWLETAGPLIQAWETADTHDANPPDPETLIAERAGISSALLVNLREGRQQTISVNYADKVFCVLGHPMIWQEDERLAHYYWNGEVPPDGSKPVKCANPNCDNWFSLEEYDGAGAVPARRIRPRRYCDANCKGRAHHLKNPRSRARAVKRHRHKNREAYNAYMRAYRRRRAAMA